MGDSPGRQGSQDQPPPKTRIAHCVMQDHPALRCVSAASPLSAPPYDTGRRSLQMHTGK
jgi:hypothetical protein